MLDIHQNKYMLIIQIIQDILNFLNSRKIPILILIIIKSNNKEKKGRTRIKRHYFKKYFYKKLVKLKQLVL